MITTIMTAPGNLHAFVYTGDGWVMMHEERQANTHDQYWDEPPSTGPTLTRDNMSTFYARSAWCWSETHEQYMTIMAEGRFTHFGRSLLQTLRPVKTMLNYAP